MKLAPLSPILSALAFTALFLVGCSSTRPPEFYRLHSNPNASRESVCLLFPKEMEPRKFSLLNTPPRTSTTIVAVDNTQTCLSVSNADSAAKVIELSPGMHTIECKSAHEDRVEWSSHNVIPLRIKCEAGKAYLLDAIADPEARPEKPGVFKKRFKIFLRDVTGDPAFQPWEQLRQSYLGIPGVGPLKMMPRE